MDRGQLEHMRNTLPQSVEEWLERLEALIAAGIPNQTREQDEAEFIANAVDDPSAWEGWTLSDEPKDMEIVRRLVRHLRFRNPEVLKAAPLHEWILDVATGERKLPPPQLQAGQPKKTGRDEEIVFTLLALRQLDVPVHMAGEHTTGCRLISKHLGEGYSYHNLRGIWKRRDKALADRMDDLLKRII